MRLIDADLLMKNCKCTGKFEDNFKCVSLAGLREVIENQPIMFEAEENGKKLMEIYKLFNIDGSLKRKLTVEEMVMLYHIADVMRGGRDEE